MKLEFSINTSPPNYAYKNLTNTIIIPANECRMKEPVDVLNPILQIKRDRFAGTWSGYNYVKIEAFGRCYFAKFKADLGQFLDFECNVDALSTYITQLVGKSFEVERASNSNKGDSLLFADTERPLQINKKIERAPAQRLLILPQNSGGGYFMTVAGGAAT